MKKFLYILLFSCFAQLSTFAQLYSSKYLQICLNSDIHKIYHNEKDSSNLLLIATLCDSSNNFDFGLIKLNKNGQVVDSFKYTTLGRTLVYDLQKYNNYYWVVGSDDLSTSDNYGFKIYKINEQGQIVNSKLILNKPKEFGFKLIKKDNSIFAFGVNYTKDSSYNYSIHVFDTNANLVSSRYFGSSKYEIATDVINTNNRDFIIVGTSYLDSTAIFSRLDISRLDRQGQIKWRKTINLPWDTLFGKDYNCGVYTSKVVEDLNGNLYLASHLNRCVESYIYHAQAMITSLDSNGNIRWIKRNPFFKGDNNSTYFNELFNNIIITNDNKLLCSGYIEVPSPGLSDGDAQVLLVKFDLQGNFIWKRVVGKDDALENLYDVQVNQRGDILLAGRYANYNDTILNVEGVKGFFYHLDPCGCLSPNCDPNCNPNGIATSQNKNTVKVYPNPTNNSLYIASQEMIVSYSIYTMLGEKIVAQDFNNQDINVSNLKAGIYIFQFKSINGNVRQTRFVKE